MANIRLAAIDMDGTALRGDRSLHPENIAAIHRATERGIQVALASGRMFLSLRRFADDIGLEMPIVSSNGAYVVDDSAQIVLNATVSDSIALAILDYCESHQLHVNLYTGSGIACVRETSWLVTYAERVQNFSPEPLGLDACREISPNKMLIFAEPEDLDTHGRTLRDMVPPGLGTWVRSEPDFLELLPPDVTKGYGLSRLAAHMDVPPVEVAAIGDYLNDLEMLEWAGTAAAVANAHPKILETAGVVYPSNEEAGVAAFLDALG
ncbi:MAG: HAD family phosphatase [Chthonomonas sp.]|nr:HAD family phosphatase [Chthonomonas sp.]